MILTGLFAAGFILLAAPSCNKIPVEPPPGTLCWSFAGLPGTRAVLALPDTDDFILEVRNPAGEALYEGPYGASPESLLVEPGNYSVKVVSRKFSVPAFDAPQFGDEQVVVVRSGIRTEAVLNCTQLNAGIRLKIKDGFRDRHPSASIAVSSSDGSLTYSHAETRIGYFKPGMVSLTLQEDGNASPLMTRHLEPCEILSLGISCAQEVPGLSGGRLTITVDTTRFWNREEFVIGAPDPENGPGASKETALSVAQARNLSGAKGVWVTGFIVGGDLSSAKNGISFAAPFSSRTNIAIAYRSSVNDKSSCMSVQLSKGAFRDAVNLVDHPELLGGKIFLKGDVVDSYYGIPGLRNLSECEIKNN